MALAIVRLALERRPNSCSCAVWSRTGVRVPVYREFVVVVVLPPLVSGSLGGPCTVASEEGEELLVPRPALRVQIVVWWRP